VLGGLLVGFACAAWGFGWEPRTLVEREYALSLPRWSPECDGMRFDVISDLHTGSPHNGVDNLDRIVRRLVLSDADAVLMAGDYLILSVFLGTYVPPETVAERLKPLTARKPVYAVLGNHDWWKDGGKVRVALEAAGVTVLENQASKVALGDCRMWMVGIGDLWEGKPDIARAFAQVVGDAPVLAITHNPDVFPKMPARASLLVAGHTHGGQVSLPLLGRPVLPARERYAIGEYVEDGRHLFVSPGIGTSIMPVRFGVPPEISRLTLRSQQ
jgi:predicted MPP superfamily phosphohydrolase